MGGHSPTRGSPTEGSSARKKSSYNFRLLKAVGIVAEQKERLFESQVFLLKGLHMDLLTDRLTHAELQCLGSSSKSIRNIHIVLKLSKINNKDRILKAVREKKTVTYKGKPIRLPSNFSVQTL